MKYLRIWLASARYSIVRTMMFRGDFLTWTGVEFVWMCVHLLLLEVLFSHTSAIAGWSKYQMLLLVGTSMLIQRLLMGFFWSNLFEIGRNVRSGTFDFFLTQPGNPLFMVSTRKLDPDGLVNAFVAIAVIFYAAVKLDLNPSAGEVALYIGTVLCGLLIHYSLMLLLASLSFWIIKSDGVEHSYFTITEFSRLPRDAFKSLLLNMIFVYVLPAVIVSNIPASILLGHLELHHLAWLVAVTIAWFAFAFTIFHRGIRRYTSASS